MRELLDIKSSLQTASQVKNFLLVTVAEGPLAGKQFPVVTGLAEMLSEERRLCDHIDRCILSEDEMADGASPAAPGYPQKDFPADRSGQDADPCDDFVFR